MLGLSYSEVDLLEVSYFLSTMISSSPIIYFFSLVYSIFMYYLVVS